MAIAEEALGAGPSRNGLSVVSGFTELGGTLIRNTTVSGNNYTYRIEFDKTALIRIKGQDKIGSNFPMWVNVDRTGQSYGTATGDTMGRVYRLQDNSLSRFLDFGFDESGLGYFTKIHAGLFGSTISDIAALRIDSSGRLAVGNNMSFPLTTPAAWLHLAPGKAAVGNGPLKFTITNAVLVSTPEAGLMEVDPTTGLLYYTPSSTRKTLAFEEDSFINAIIFG